MEEVHNFYNALELPERVCVLLMPQLALEDSSNIILTYMELITTIIEGVINF